MQNAHQAAGHLIGGAQCVSGQLPEVLTSLYRTNTSLLYLSRAPNAPGITCLGNKFAGAAYPLRN